MPNQTCSSDKTDSCLRDTVISKKAKLRSPGDGVGGKPETCPISERMRQVSPKALLVVSCGCIIAGSKDQSFTVTSRCDCQGTCCWGNSLDYSTI